MHRCLLIPELIEKIVNSILPSSIYTDGDPALFELLDLQEPHRDLAALARTSKLFLEPSLDVLWRDLESLVPIWTVLDTRINAYGNYVQDAVRNHRLEIENANLDRLMYYLPRVRNLQVEENGTQRLMLKTLLIRYRNIGTPVVPNLRCLVFSALYRDWYEELPMICGPGVTRLAVYPFFQDKGIIQAIDACPSLKEIKFLGFRPSIRNSKSYLNDIHARYLRSIRLREWDASKIILSLPPPHHVDCSGHPLTSEAIIYLSTMPRLQSLIVLDVRDSKDLDARLSTHVPNTLTFPALCTLHLTSISADAFTHFFEAFRNLSTLRDLHVGYAYTGVILPLTQYTEAIGAVCNPLMLRKFEIGPGREGERRLIEHPLPCTGLTLLQSLLPFRNMAFCSIVAPAALICNDALLESIASAWPALHHLALLAHPKHQHHSNVTLRGLVFLAEGCPQLDYIALNLGPPTDERVRLDDVVRTWRHSTQARSATLRMWLGGLDKVAAGRAPEVGMYLRRIFPYAVCEVSDGHVDYWLNHDRSGHLEEAAYVDGFWVKLPHALYEQ